MEETIHVPITELELQELMDGKEFNWVLGEKIEFHIYKSEQERTTQTTLEE